MTNGRSIRDAHPTPDGFRRPAKLLMTMLTIAVGACAADAPPAQIRTTEATARVIVRFRAGVPEPASAASLSSLAARAGVPRITLIRQMSGDAYVMEVACGASSGSDPCPAAIARIGAVETVQFVEVDRRERIQSP